MPLLAAVPERKILSLFAASEGKPKSDDLKLLQNNTKKLHRQPDSSDDEADEMNAKPTAKQMVIIEKLIYSMKKASERNKTNMLRQEFIEMNKKYQRTLLPGEKSVPLGVFM